MKLDKFDLEILTCLDLDARQSYAEIGKKINRSKQFVAYRIKNLIESKTIERFCTDIDLRKMGYTLFNIFLQLQKINDKDEEKIVQYLKNSKYVGFCLKTLGNWDLFLSIKTEGINDFYKFLGAFHNNFAKFIKKESINLELDSIATNLRFLNNMATKMPEYVSVNKLVNEKRNFYKIEEEILQELRKEPLINYVDLSIKLKKSHETIRKIIKSLSKENILKRTSAIISTEKLGFERYLFLIELPYLNSKQKEEILNYLKKEKNIDYMMECIGSWNIICNVYSRNIKELMSIINRFKKEFNSIGSIEFLRIIEHEKETFSLK